MPRPSESGSIPTAAVPLEGKQAAILVADNFQVHEAYYPYFRFREAGGQAIFVGDEAGKTYRDYHGEPLRSSLDAQSALQQDFDYLHIPGGFAPMKMRANADMLKLACDHYGAGQLLSAICHAGSFLVAMNILKGRRATCFFTLKDDLVNAGAEYIDDAPIIDGNLITARTPGDLPAFMEAVVRYLEGGISAATTMPAQLPLEGKVVALLVEPRYQVHQVWYPYYRLKAAGCEVQVVSARKRNVCRSRISRLDIKSDMSVRDALDKEFDALIVPGDWAADRMRTNRAFLELVREQLKSGRLLVSIAEGHSVVISADAMRGRQVGGLPEMAKDIENSGASWIDNPVVMDSNLITARDTDDLPELMRCVMSRLTSN
ncbi:MAG: DJ-1/PfpI family protein [Fidelibacterota bacterium]|nr:MAG: DJ-1/PfpI family protein [Candidatus Neomarinimicrobiota bacterium]